MLLSVRERQRGLRAVKMTKRITSVSKSRSWLTRVSITINYLKTFTFIFLSFPNLSNRAICYIC